MKRLFSTFMIIAVVGALVGCSKPLSGTYVDKDKREENSIAELEETIKRQEEEIKQLQAKISEQQEKKERLETKRAVQRKNNAIAESIRRRIKECREVRVSGEVVRISFCGALAAVYYSAHPESIARADLNLFLEKTGRKTGKINYYNSVGRKMFSISGSLSSVKIEKY